MRASILVAALWGIGCVASPIAPPPPPAPAPVEREEPMLVLEAPAGSGLRRARPAIVRVVDVRTGAGIAGATVDGPGATERTDADGFCELPRDTGTPRAWTVTADGYAPGVVRGIAGGTAIALRPGAPLALQVRDTFDRPVPGARIALVGWLTRPPLNGAPDGPPDFELQHILAGSEGRGRFGAVEGLEYVRVSAANHLTLEAPIAAIPAESDGLVLRLRQWPGGDYLPQSPQEPSGVELLVRDAATLDPVAGLSLRLESFEPGGALFAARTGADGVARVRCAAGEYACLPSGPFATHSFERVNVSATSERGRFLVRARRNPLVAFEVAEVPAGVTLVCAVAGAQRDVVAGTPVAVRAGLPMVLTAAGHAIGNVWRVEPLANDEALRAVQLRWTPYSADRPSHRNWMPKVIVSSGATLIVDVRDPKGRFVSGRVSVDGVRDGRGSRVKFDVCSPGAHRVVVWGEGREVLVNSVVLKDATTTRLLVRLRPLDE